MGRAPGVLGHHVWRDDRLASWDRLYDTLSGLQGWRVEAARCVAHQRAVLAVTYETLEATAPTGAEAVALVARMVEQRAGIVA